MAQNGNVVYNTILQLDFRPETALQLFRNEVGHNIKEVQHTSLSFPETCEDDSPDPFVLV